MNTQTASLSQLRDAHNAWIARWKERGKSALTYPAPCCGKNIETPAPPEGETWDSLTTCPHCGGMHFKSVTHTAVRASILRSHIRGSE